MRLLYVAAAVLAATALFHASGYPDVAAASTASNLDPTLQRAVGALWLNFSLLLILAAGLLVYVARSDARLTGLIGVVVALTLLEAVGVARVAGPRFPGVWMLVAAALLAMASVLLDRQARKRARRRRAERPSDKHVVM